MSISLTEEKFGEILRESAVRRFGEERTQILNPAIKDIAHSLAAVAQHRVRFEDELSFC